MWKAYNHFIILQILIYISQHRGIMVRVVPAPWRQPNEIILTIELQALNIRLDDFLIFWVCFYVIYPKSSLVVLLSPFSNGLVLNLEVLDVLHVLSIRLILIVLIPVGLVLAAFVAHCHLNHVFGPSSLPFKNHLLNHLRLEFFPDFEQFVNIFPINPTSFINELFVVHQISLITR